MKLSVLQHESIDYALTESECVMLKAMRRVPEGTPGVLVPLIIEHLEPADVVELMKQLRKRYKLPFVYQRTIRVLVEE